MRIAFVTYAGLPALSPDDLLAIRPLAARGVHAEPAAWDDPAVSWTSYDGLVVRSAWNYHTRPDAFRGWIETIESLRVPMWNPPALLRWNANKAYLRDLERNGVDIVPTRWIERGTRVSLREALEDVASPNVVIKPAVSASAYETWRVDRDQLRAEDESRFGSLTGRGTVMIQPFVPELARDGEWSLMFFRGRFSHAVLKRPAAGDFRVQHEHGGLAEPRTPPPDLVTSGERIVSLAPTKSLYARVDGVMVDGRFVLMELELLEPSLFLGSAPGAADRFADAIEVVVKSAG